MTALNIVKMPILPKLIHRFNTFPIKYEQDYFQYRKDHMDYMEREKGTRIAETTFKRLSLEIILPDFKSYAASLIKTVV